MDELSSMNTISNSADVISNIDVSLLIQNSNEEILHRVGQTKNVICLEIRTWNILRLISLGYRYVNYVIKWELHINQTKQLTFSSQTLHNI